MSVRDEIADYTIDDAEQARRLGERLARFDWPRLPDADETLRRAHRAYDHASRSVTQRLNRASFVAAFTLAHLETLLDLDEHPPTPQRRFRRGRR